VITLLVPLAQNRVRYTAASGRRFHIVDQVLLNAIQRNEAVTLPQMQELFRLPRRMVVEVLVTLLEDNIIQLKSGSADTFELTEAAAEARRSGSATPRTGCRLEERTTTVVMERLTGALIHRNDIALSSKSELFKTGVWDKAMPLPSEYEHDVADEGEVRPFIRPGHDHWLYRILQIEMAGDGSYWLPVDVDPEKGEVIGLPYHWQPRLRPVLMEFAAGAPRELTSSWQFWSEPKTTGKAKELGWATQLSPDAILFSRRQHVDFMLDTIISAPTDSALFISSPTYHGGWLGSGVCEAIRDAAFRGVHIDILWGVMARSAGVGGTPLDQLRNLEEELRSKGASGSIRFNTRPHSSRSALLVASLPSETVVCVSSYPWLDDGTGTDEEYCGVRLSHPGVAAEVCWSVAAFLIDAGQKLTTSPYRWRTIAGELERQVSDGSTSGDSRITVFRGQAGTVADIVTAGIPNTLIATRDLNELRYSRLSSLIASTPGTVCIRSASGRTQQDGRFAVSQGLAAETVSNGMSCAIFSAPLLEDHPGGRPMSVNIRIDGGLLPEILRSRLLDRSA